MTQIDKLNLLLRSGQSLFHTQDLALLWRIENRNTLYTTIKRYVKNGTLIQITKGLYSKIPIAEVNKYAIGTALIHRFCYVSCETVLAQEGVINQSIPSITFVSSVSLKIEFNRTLYVYRKSKPEILLNSDGVERKDGYFIASRERAISDMLYFNPKYYLDNNAR
jgi:predicted transcriptional regulator of viral defense system